MVSPSARATNLARQFAAITAVLPGARGAVGHGQLTCTVDLQPTPARQVYTVRVVYRHGRAPQVTVTDPQLDRYPGIPALPHVYRGDVLCLYYPGQWNEGMMLVSTILPWTAEWLLRYELWLVTGHWVGGDQAHEAMDPGNPTT
jgi:hypothetical protein